MKKLMVFILATALVIPAFSQGLFKTLVDKYADKEGFSAVQLTKDMFELYLKKKHIDEQHAVYGVVKNLDNILVITQTKIDDQENTLKSIQSEIVDYYRKNNSTLFKTEKTNSRDLKIFINKKEDKVTNLGLINLTPMTLTLIEINGLIDLTSIASIGDAFDIQGLEKLRRVNEDDSYSSYSFSIPEIPGIPEIPEFDFPEMRLKELDKKELEKLKDLNIKIEIDGKKIQDEIKKHHDDIMIFQNDKWNKSKRVGTIIDGMGDADYYIDGVRVDKEKADQLSGNKIKRISITKKNGLSAIVKITTK